jgi:hypothetical protein
MMETILHILSKDRGENPRWTRHDDDQIRSHVSCMLFPVIVRGGSGRPASGSRTCRIGWAACQQMHRRAAARRNTMR